MPPKCFALSGDTTRSTSMQLRCTTKLQVEGNGTHTIVMSAEYASPLMTIKKPILSLHDQQAAAEVKCALRGYHDPNTPMTHCTKCGVRMAFQDFEDWTEATGETASGRLSTRLAKQYE